MANYCGKCGSRLDEATGLCPNCDAAKIKQHCDKTLEAKTPIRKEENIDKQVKKKALKARKKAAKREKQANWSIGKKIRRFFLKLISTVILLTVLAAGVTGTLVYFDVVDIPFLSDFNQNRLLKPINQRNIIVKEKSIDMASDTEGTATLVVTIPNYELLFKEAVTTENPDNYLLKALLLKDYETQEFEISAEVTVENGEKIVHSDEAVHQLLEECLVNAVYALVEEES